MRRFDLKALAGTLTAATIAGAALLGTASARAADFDLDPTGDEAVVESSAEGLLDEEVYGTASVERRSLERRAHPGPVIERHIVERPVMERRIVERRVIRPIPEPRAVKGRIVTRRVVNSVEEPDLVPPQYVPPVRPTRSIQSVTAERRAVRVAPPVEECRVLERRYVNDLGERVTETVRKCD